MTKSRFFNSLILSFSPQSWLIFGMAFIILGLFGIYSSIAKDELAIRSIGILMWGLSSVFSSNKFLKSLMIDKDGIPSGFRKLFILVLDFTGLLFVILGLVYFIL